MMSILKKIMKVKHKLPLNGDWLFVTISHNEEDDQLEDGQNLNLPDDAVINDDVIKEFSKLSNEFASDVENRATQVREKAKVIWQSAGIIFTVFFTVTSILLKHLENFNIIFKITLIILVILMINHLSRALNYSINVLTRENSVLLSCDSLVENTLNTENVNDYIKNISLVKLKNAVQNNHFVTEKVNQLIIAQNSLIWGIRYLAVVLLTIIILLFFSNKVVEEKKTMVFPVEKSYSIINEKESQLDVKTTIVNGRLLVPARFLAENLGAKVQWDQKNREVIISSENK